MDYEAFKREILRLSGIDLGLYKERQMKRRMESLMHRHGCKDFGDYVRRIERDEKAYNEFVDYLTINVSEFFRNAGQWQVLEQEVLPGLAAAARAAGRPIRIWSAACSTGEEPYSLAMLLSSCMPGSRYRILASDIDAAALEKAKAGAYGHKSLKGLPEGLRERFFKMDGDIWRIGEEVRAAIRFERLDLLKDRFPVDLDLIVCRNVLIYLTEEAKDGLYRKFNQSLREGGILFVGSTEQIIRARDYGFESTHSFFYRKAGKVPT